MLSIHVFTPRAAARLIAAAGLALALAASAALAQQLTDAQKSAMRASCRSDYMANCSSVRPGGKEALDCLKSHMASLSPACQNAVSAAMPKPPPPAAAASPPPPPAAAPAAIAPPPPAAPKPAAVAAPIPATPAKPMKAETKTAAPKPPLRPVATAPPPPAAVAPPPEPVVPMGRIENLSLRVRLGVIHSCRADEAVLCRGIRPGHARLIACLAAHRGALSPPCRRTLARALQ